jgi:hypothetical protein
MNAVLSVFVLRVEGLEARSDSLAHVVEKHDCLLSPNTKLADQAKGALLLEEALAQSFADAVLPVMRKRHGEQVRLVIQRWESSPSGSELARQLARARHDTSIVRARLRERNFTPNRAPLVIASDLT